MTFNNIRIIFAELSKLFTLRSYYEKCNKGLNNNSLAYICTQECTFCKECTLHINYV
ncbi:hypothetical protein CHH57_10285 [Niallia circulans]|uniref:Uncharacterized protein n=1 Tax=Niallia circulans TaxID=1397 RepID=A0AA91TSC8_NIACI|nr:DUF1272 domain-containing protein [Niallia circulans]PAD83305.1 hypothetical protein CHH57_10285 [Niallia circulans]